jgi:S1-C subfamily serine protease
MDPKSGALGDVIMTVEGHPAHHLTELTDQLEQMGVGKTVELSIKRDRGTNRSRFKSPISADSHLERAD